MRSELLIEAIDTHTEGEPTRIITGGLNRDVFEGGSVAQQRDAFAAELDHIRRLLMKEPRGHADMFGAVIVRTERDDADLGLFFMDNDGYLDMCGHGTMGVVTALIETGQLEAKSPIRIETPAGIVLARPEMASDGRVERVGVQNVSSYVIDSVEVPVSIDGTTKPVPADIVYAGNIFALVPAESVDLSVDTTNTNAFIDLGLDIRSAINDEVDLRDPLTGEPTAVDLTEFYEPADEGDRNIVVFADGSVDRSPCGTGTCAKMTLLHSKGDLDLEESYVHRSVIDTRFEGRLRDYEDDEGVRITTPEVAGSAYIVANHTFMLDPDDPVPSFSVSET